MDDNSEHYSEHSFWEKVKTFAKRAGRKVIYPALTLYHCLQDSDTPKWAKGVITSALGYFILPADAIPDPTPVVGFADDLGALTAALAMVAAHIKPAHRESAKEKVKDWFGDDESEDDVA